MSTTTRKVTLLKRETPAVHARLDMVMSIMPGLSVDDLMDEVAAWEAHDHDVATGVPSQAPHVSRNVR